MNLKYHEGNGTNVVKILPHNTAMEFGMSELQRDIWTWVISIATCLCQTIDHVYSFLELTDIKVYRLLCLQECMNIRMYSVEVEPILKWDPKLWKATLNLIMSFRLSVRHPTLNNLSAIDKCSWKLISAHFCKNGLGNSKLIRIWKETWVYCSKICVYYW